MKLKRRTIIFLSIIGGILLLIAGELLFEKWYETALQRSDDGAYHAEAVEKRNQYVYYQIIDNATGEIVFETERFPLGGFFNAALDWGNDCHDFFVLSNDTGLHSYLYNGSTWEKPHIIAIVTDENGELEAAAFYKDEFNFTAVEDYELERIPKPIRKRQCENGAPERWTEERDKFLATVRNVELFTELPLWTHEGAQSIAMELKMLYEHGHIPFYRISKLTQTGGVYDEDAIYLSRTILAETEDGSRYLIETLEDRLVYSIIDDGGEGRLVYAIPLSEDRSLPYIEFANEKSIAMDPQSNLTEIATVKYSETELQEIAAYRNAFFGLYRQFPIESMKKVQTGYRVSYLGEHSVVLLMIDSAASEILYGWVYRTDRMKSDFDALEIGQSLGDVRELDPNGQYLFLYSGRNESPRVSTHCTKDGYLFSIEYDDSGNIICINEELI